MIRGNGKAARLQREIREEVKAEVSSQLYKMNSKINKIEGIMEIYQELEDKSTPMGLNGGKSVMGIDREIYLKNKNKIKKLLKGAEDL